MGMRPRYKSLYVRLHYKLAEGSIWYSLFRELSIRLRGPAASYKNRQDSPNRELSIDALRFSIGQVYDEIGKTSETHHIFALTKLAIDLTKNANLVIVFLSSRIKLS